MSDKRKRRVRVRRRGREKGGSKRVKREIRKREREEV